MNVLSANSGADDRLMWAVMVVALIVLLVLFAILLQFIGLYISALVSGARVSMRDLVGMRLRRVNAATIVRSRVQAVHAGIDVSVLQMESHYLAGGDVPRVVAAMIVAHKGNVELTWTRATALDLMKRDVLAEVSQTVKNQTSLTGKGNAHT